MRNKILFLSFLFSLIFNLSLFAEEFEINSSKIQYDDKNKITVFEDNVTLNDKIGNKLFSEYIKYNKSAELIETIGETKIITSGGYEVLSSNVILNNKKNTIYSNDKTNIIDKDGNKIFVEMFNYSISNNIFFSKGKIKIKDINNNDYNFSEIYIDENKSKIIGSDIKAFLNQSNLTKNVDNDPRFFANTFSLSNNTSTFEKGIFTYCKNRGDDKCPPWVLQSKKIKHDLSTKTIYYDNVILKVYDFPIFYSPKFSHPDPTVKRRSGLLAPAISNSTTLGSGFATPYFWSLAADKDITITPKFYINENPLILTEYRQDFVNSFLIVDTGYTKGYKKKSNIKSGGGRAHFFSNLNFSLISEEDEKSSLELKIEKVSNDTYFKVHDVKSSLVEKDKTVLENKLDFIYQKKDLYLGLNPSVYEDTTKLGHLRYEYLLPLTIEKNLMSGEKYGYLDLASNLRVRNFDTNKQVDLFVNDFKWKSYKWLNSFGAENYFEALFKNVNYKANNAERLKNDKNNSELQTAVGYLTKINLFKEDAANRMFHSLTPKMLLRYAPGHMRRTTGGRLNYGNLFNLNKVNQLDVIESGASASIGFEYTKSELVEKNNIGDEIFSFSLGQVISEKENKDMPSSTSLDNRFSDIVGSSKYNLNDTVKINYNFSIDQSYKNFNYNEIGANFIYDRAKFNISYLQEKNHIGNLESFQTGLDLNINNSSELSFNTKRNLLTNSAEFYNLNYNYINDCLKAGIGYRREFYTDRDVEPTNTLMFTISIVPFAEINSPGLSR